MSIRISITGVLGSGKSSVCRELQSRRHLEFFSTGAIQRHIAAEKGMSTYELNRYSERHPEIDRLIDDKLIALSDASVDMVIDSRMAWHFVSNSFKVFLTTDEIVAARRIMGDERGCSETYASLAEAKEKLDARKKSENLRYKSKYGVDCNDFRNYDLVVDTSDISTAAVAEHILTQFEQRQAGKPYPIFWISPKCLYPTKGITEISDAIADEYAAVDVLVSNGRFYIFDGHHRTAARIRRGDPLIPCHMVAQDEDEVIGGVSADRYAAKEFSLTKAADWEAFNNLRYYSYPGCNSEQ